MDDAPLPAREADSRFLTHLPAEVRHWEEAGVITPEQGRTILDGYEFHDAAQQSRSRLVTVLVILGAVLLGLGVILFFAANWQGIPAPAKLGMMLVGVPAVYAVGFWLRYLRGYPRVGAAIILLGAIFYGASIHLIAQVYQVPVDSPNLVLYWFLGVLPLAYVVGVEPLMVLALVLGLAAVGFRGQEWLLDTEHIPFLAFPLYLVLGLTLVALAKLQGVFPTTRSFARVYEIVGLLTVFGAVYLLGFQRVWSEFRWSGGNGYVLPVTAEFWAIVGVAVAVAVLAWVLTLLDASRKGRTWGILLNEGLASLSLLALAGVVVFLGETGTAFLFNLVLLAGVVGLVFLGYVRSREFLINLGIIFFCIGVFTRYFEFGFGLLDRSVVFIVAGLILIIGGFLVERGRRRVVDRMREQGGTGNPDPSGEVSHEP